MNDWFSEQQALTAKRAAHDEMGEHDPLPIAAIRAALRAVNPFEWRGIESAPKTNHAIMVFCPAYRNIYIVSWIVPLDDNAKADPANGFWSHFGGGSSRLNERPTHWLPLPPTPESE